MEKTVIELICKKSFYEGDKLFFKEGDTYNARKATDEYGDYFVVYQNHKDDSKIEPDLQVFNSTYDKIPKADYPCIMEYFYTKAEWREKQIDSIFE
jgi:hypothetical protein